MPAQEQAPKATPTASPAPATPSAAPAGGGSRGGAPSVSGPAAPGAAGRAAGLGSTPPSTTELAATRGLDAQQAKVAPPGASAAAAPDAAAAEAAAKAAALRSRLSSERSAITGAKSFSDIATAIDGSQATEKQKGEAAVKLRNVDRGVERAREYFQKNNMAAEEKAFIDDRYAGALADQRSGIADVGKKQLALGQILAKPDPELTEANYNDLQWDAVFGTNSAATLKPELLVPEDMKASVTVAKGRGGLAKLLSVKNLWDAMDPGLQELWIQSVGGGAAAADPASASLSPEDKKKADKALAEKAMNAWIAQTSATGAPAIVPEATTLNPARFARFSSLAAAFSKPMSGCMGMADDYGFKSVAEACDALGLKPETYASGAFVLKIDGAALDDTVARAVTAGGGVGKATVFTSLMFSEFNYNAEDRATNETASGDKKVNPDAKENTGKKVAGGKTEVVVQKFQATDIFAQSPTFLR